MVLAVVALLALPLVSVQPNRIMPGEGLRLFAVLGGPLGGAVSLFPIGLAWLVWRPTRGRLWACLVLVALWLVALPWALAIMSGALLDPSSPQARLGIGAGLWVLAFLSVLALIEVSDRLALPTLSRWALLMVMMASLALALAGGGLDALSLMREYQGRSAQFLAAVRYHMVLVGAAVGISLLLAAALALAMRRWWRLRRGIFGVLGVIQTIPSLALFGLLLAPLAYLAARAEWLAELGVRGIGWAPALIALVGYSLLPMTRNTFVALDEVPADVIDAARGMGMSSSQVFLQVRMPLALPVMLEGIRITMVQAIGLAAVAALIGAGGLGTFVFQGLGQAAMDLVLLGALPIIAMALLADALLSVLAGHIRRGQGHG